MLLKRFIVFATGVLLALPAFAQYKEAAEQPAEDKVVLTLDDALKIALSENTSTSASPPSLRSAKNSAC